jgi:hypothetical protein
MVEITIEFEEISPVENGHLVDGIMLCGRATLTSADPTERHSFRVTRIELGSARRPYRLSPHGAYRGLHEAICAEIYNDRSATGRAAQDAFAEAADAECEPDLDRAYDERRDHQAMGWM